MRLIPTLKKLSVLCLLLIPSLVHAGLRVNPITGRLDLVGSSSGSGASPAGPATAVQINTGTGTFTGSAHFTFDDSASLATLNGINTRLTLHDIGNEDTAFIRISGGEFSHIIQQDSDATIFSGFHIQYGGGNQEYVQNGHNGTGATGGYIWAVNSHTNLYINPSDYSVIVPYALRVGKIGCIGDPGSCADDGSTGILEVTGYSHFTGSTTVTSTATFQGPQYSTGTAVFRSSVTVQSSMTVTGTGQLGIPSFTPAGQLPKFTVWSDISHSNNNAFGVLSNNSSGDGGVIIKPSMITQYPSTAEDIGEVQGTNSNLSAVANLAIQGEGGKLYIGAMKDDGSSATTQISGTAHFGGGAVSFGDGSTLGVGAAYMQATSAGGDAGYIANRDNTGHYVSFDLLDNSNPSTGWSMQMQPGSEDLHFVDRVAGIDRMTFTSAGDISMNGPILANGGDIHYNGGDLYVQNSGGNLYLGHDGNTYYEASNNIFDNGPINASTVNVTLNGSTWTARLGGTVFDFYNSTGNNGTSETDLYVSSITKYVMNAVGDKIFFKFVGTYLGSTSSKDLKVYVGTTSVYDSTALPVSSNGSWSFSGWIVRDGATTVRVQTDLIESGATLSTPNNYLTVGGFNFLTQGFIIKVTGTASGVGAATNDVVGRMATGELKAARL